jgi:hypothetical protein
VKASYGQDVRGRDTETQDAGDIRTPGYYKEQVDIDERISNDGEFVHSAQCSVGSQAGENVSHGCVNLSPANAQWFFDHFALGDVVEITNSGGLPLPLFDTNGDGVLPWPQWQRGGAS